MLKYKLTNQKLQTHNGFQWVIGEKKITNGEGDLCGKGWLHFYHHPLLAVLLNPIHAKIDNPRLFEIEADGQFKEDRGLKAGCTQMTLISEIKLPVLSTNQKTAFAILCAKEVYKNVDWNKWANNWLNNSDRSNAAAAAYAADAYAAAAYAAAYAADAAYAAAAYAAAYAAAAYAAAAYAAAADDFLINNAIKCLEY